MEYDIKAISTEEFLPERTEVDETRRKILADLLGKTIARQGQFLAYASSMGRTAQSSGEQGVPVPSYTVIHSLEWISQNIKLGAEMPFMLDKIDHETGRMVVDRSNADEIKQRAPDCTRQAALSAYLAQPQRKFGPIMAVISPEWVEEPNHANWNEHGRAKVSAAEFNPLEASKVVGMLNLNNVRVYALDGQHRVLGMRGLLEVRDKGFLQLRSKDGSPRGLQMSRETFFEKFGLTVESLQSIFNDTMAVEYTPAVVEGETHEEATRRIRRTFIAINSYAKKTDKGENILLDETDGFAIVARRIAVNHPLFAGGDSKQRVNWKGTSISNGRIPFITTLSTIQEIAAAYLTASLPRMVKKWKASLTGMVPVRPADEELEAGYVALSEYFDFVNELPLFKRLKGIAPEDEIAFLEKWREFPRYTSKGASVEGTAAFRGHLLLRPLGQVILANAVAALVTEPEVGKVGLTLKTVFRRLSTLDSEDGFEAHRPGNVWWGVTYNAETTRVLNRGKSWGHKLLVQLVVGYKTRQAQLDLWETWVYARRVDIKTMTWKNLDGRVARFTWDEPQLPEPIKE